ncbi:MAG: hypothetical protein LBR30_05075 [Clostridioides sp.]|jgi:hypothetical protein|nr:hypothetical protein [Clostridioides sp.]
MRKSKKISAIALIIGVSLIPFFKLMYAQEKQNKYNDKNEKTEQSLKSENENTSKDLNSVSNNENAINSNSNDEKDINNYVKTTYETKENSNDKLNIKTNNNENTTDNKNINNNNNNSNDNKNIDNNDKNNKDNKKADVNSNNTVKSKMSKQDALEILKKYYPDLEFYYQGNEDDFDYLKENGYKGYVFLPNVDGDIGYYVNSDNSKVYYFHPSGYMELAE